MVAPEKAAQKEGEEERQRERERNLPDSEHKLGIPVLIMKSIINEAWGLFSDTACLFFLLLVVTHLDVGWDGRSHGTGIKQGYCLFPQMFCFD